MIINKCKYCGEPATYYFKSAEYWCCEPKFYKCEGWKNKHRQISLKRNKGSKMDKLRQLVKNQTGECKYCGSVGKYIINDFKLCCSKNAYECPEYNNWLSNVHKRSYELHPSYRKNMSEAMLEAQNRPEVIAKKSESMKKLHNETCLKCTTFQENYKIGIENRINETYIRNVKWLQDNGYSDIIVPDDPKELAIIMNRIRVNIKKEK